MVKIWFVRNNIGKTTGDSEYQLPLDDCVNRLGLSPDHFLCSIESTPEFGIDHRANFRGPSHVVCEVQDTNAVTSQWKPGFYRIQLSPEQVRERLGPPG